MGNTLNKEFLDKVVEWMYQDTRGEWNCEVFNENIIYGFQVTRHFKQYIQGIVRKTAFNTWIKFPFITKPLIPEQWGGKSEIGLRGRDLNFIFNMAFQEYCYNNYALQQEEIKYVYLHYLNKIQRLHSIDVIKLGEQIIPIGATSL